MQVINSGQQQRWRITLRTGATPELYDVSYMPFRLLVPGSRQAGKSGTAFREGQRK
jgi:hypothetical protein